MVTARYENALRNAALRRRLGTRGRHSRPTSWSGAGQSPGPRRLASLDGLRGVAATVVLLHHILLSQPVFAGPYGDPSAAQVGTALWWLTYTPLHLIWAGTEAVFVFFVLSGMVLTLAAAPGRFSVWSYYPSRIIRLYVPVWVAVAFAAALATVVPPVWGEGASWWMAANTNELSTAGILHDAVLLFAPGTTNHVLWSLQWEVVFSLTLPLFLLLARAPGVRLWAKATVAVLAITIANEIGSVALSALSLFLLGTLMASGHQQLARIEQRIDASRNRGWFWAAVIIVTAILTSAYWIVHATGARLAATDDIVSISRGLQALGACMVVFVAWHWRPARTVLESRPMQWLGVRSFSLYLVHLPVVTTVALVLGGHPPLELVLLLAVPLSLLVTMVFYRLVERPSHRLARACATRFARAAGAEPEQPVLIAVPTQHGVHRYAQIDLRPLAAAGRPG
ncbi:acyltransferase [Actinomycetes bacterium KLBMP 9759]